MKFTNLVKANLYLADRVSDEAESCADIDSYVVKIYPTKDGSKYLIATYESLNYECVYAAG